MIRRDTPTLAAEEAAAWADRDEYEAPWDFDWDDEPVTATGDAR